MAMGFPVLADFQSGVFYPPHLLFVVLPFFIAIRAIFVFHFLVASLGSYSLLRRWKFPWYASLLGALLFTVGGTIVSLTNLLNHFQTAVWLPWVILFWERVVQTVSWKNFLAFVLILVIQFLAGSPELFVFSMAFVLIDGLRVKASEPEVSYVKMMATFICANLLVIALTMVQLLPTAELVLESRRNQPIPAREALLWSLDPLRLLNLFFVDKEIDPSASIGMRLFFGREPSFIVSYYLGNVWSFGICLWLVLGYWRDKVALFCLIVSSMLFALGSYTPIYPFLLYHLPILGSFRFPEKFFFFTYALIIYASLRGLAEFLEDDRIRFKKASLVVLGAVCLAWIAAYFYVRSNLHVLARLIAVDSGVDPSSDVHAKMVAGLVSNLEQQIVLCLALLVLFALVAVGKIRRSLFGLLLVSVAFVDLSWAHRGLLFPVKAQFVYDSPTVLEAPDTNLSRLFYYPSGRNLHPGVFVINGQPPFKEAAALFFQNLLPNEGIFQGFDYFQEIDALARRPYTEFLGFANQLDPAAQIRLLRAFNVKYLVSFQPLIVNGISLVSHFPQYFSWVYRIERTIPRVYIVNKSIEEKKSEQVLQRLSSLDFDPTQAVVLNERLTINSQESLIATAKLIRYEHQRVTVHASLNDAGILVLADSYYPGWRAYVDGTEAKILRANHFFRAVALTEGEHVVEFKYEPLSFKIGLIISLMTVLLLVTISVIVFFRNRQHSKLNPI
jgi:hypothetical protein